MKPQSLRPCDVFEFHGTSWIGKAIRLFDGGDHNHSAIWTGEGLAEAAPEGFVLHSLDHAIGDGDEWVDIYRPVQFVDGSFITIGDSDFPAQPVLDRIKHYLDEGDRYSFEQLVLLALVCEVRRIAGGPLSVRMFADKLAEAALDAFGKINIIGLLSDMASKGKEPLICSESVYRCLSEAGPDYQPVILPESMHAIYRTAKPVDGILAIYNSLRADSTGINPNFVTPHDLCMSPSLMYIDRLEFKHLKATY